MLLTYMDLGYAGLKCTLPEGNELELDGNEQGWTGRAQIPLNGLDHTSVEWTGLD